MCYAFMGKFEYSFLIAQDILMSNNQIIPQIEDFQKQSKDLIRQERWQNHKIFNMDQIGLPVELLQNKVIV